MPWLFYKSERNEWSWAHVGDDGCARAESGTRFATRLECIADARLRGFGQDTGPECDQGGHAPPLESR